MKTVLILAYDFPPYVSVGSLRPYAWYRYFKQYDIYPVVVTRQWNNEHGNLLDYVSASGSDHVIKEVTDWGTMIKTPYKPNLANRLILKYGQSRFRLLRRSASAYYEFMQWVSLSGPKSELYFAAEDYIKSNKIDVIVASGDPFILFKYASKLSKRYNIPWIADYRDPWSDDFQIKDKYFLKNWALYHERNTVSSAAIITTVSTFFRQKLLKLFPQKEVCIIPNGFDPEVIKNSSDFKQDPSALNIAFTGTINPWNPLEKFLSVLADFLISSPGAKVRLNFYGVNIPEELNGILSKFPLLKNKVFIHPKMLNEELVKHLAKNSLMLLFNNYSIVGTKIYDYIGIKRTILFCFQNDNEGNELKKKYYNIKEEPGSSTHSQEDLIRETNAGYIVSDSNDLKTLLSNLWIEWQNNGSLACSTTNTEKYSRKEQTKVLAEIIQRLPVAKNV
ncbi:MAG: hypothetical protein K0Q95_2915 [Bacteroidota bacterium]|jgi:hypothetical protein|nr:hypothetical protein [Bacteroidota bacterium]